MEFMLLIIIMHLLDIGHGTNSVHGSIVDENNLSRLHKCCFDK